MTEIEYRPCLPGHLAVIEVQSLHTYEQAVLVSPEYATAACNNKAFSCWVGNRCIGAAGIIPLFPHRAIAWALISRGIGSCFVPVTKKVRAFLALDPTPRIEMTVKADFEPGHRWARLLGMQLETPTPLRKHGASGEDEVIYSRIK